LMRVFGTMYNIIAADINEQGMDASEKKIAETQGLLESQWKSDFVRTRDLFLEAFPRCLPSFFNEEVESATRFLICKQICRNSSGEPFSHYGDYHTDYMFVVLNEDYIAGLYVYTNQLPVV
jgi:hypothetical protein